MQIRTNILRPNSLQRLMSVLARKEFYYFGMLFELEYQLMAANIKCLLTSLLKKSAMDALNQSPECPVLIRELRVIYIHVARL